MTFTTLARIFALLSVLVMLGTAAATASHFHDDEDHARHDCALCTAAFLIPSIGAQPASSPFPAAALPLPPDPQGPPLCVLYRAHLLSRAPPVLG